MLEDKQRDEIFERAGEYDNKLTSEDLICEVPKLPLPSFAFMTMLIIDSDFADMIGRDKLSDTEMQDINNLFSDMTAIFEDLASLLDEANESENGFQTLIDKDNPDGGTLSGALRGYVAFIVMDMIAIVEAYSYFIKRSLVEPYATKCINKIRKDIKKAYKIQQKKFYKQVVARENLDEDYYRHVMTILNAHEVMSAFDEVINS